MGRLIDADRLKAHYAWWEIGDGEITYAEAKKRFDTIIDVQPTVEQSQTNATENMVEIVRCKDCKWCEKSSIIDVCICTHEVGLIDPKLDDYCSYGEMREDE